jgi:hypothetical protein
MNIMVFALKLTPFSGLLLDSYERLMAIYIGAFLLVGLACMILRLQELPKRNLIPAGNALAALGVASALLVAQPPIEDRLVHPQAKLGLRRSMEPMLRFVAKYVDTDRKVYVVAQNSVGFSYYIIRYELAPRIVEDFPWTFGKKLCDRDVWTHDVSTEKWASVLVEDKFDFVLVAQSDKEFWDKFRSLFAEGTTGESGLFLYRVERGSDGAVRLTPVAEAEQRMLPRMLPEINIRAVCGK